MRSGEANILHFSKMVNGDGSIKMVQVDRTHCWHDNDYDQDINISMAYCYHPSYLL